MHKTAPISILTIIAIIGIVTILTSVYTPSGRAPLLFYEAGDSVTIGDVGVNEFIANEAQSLSDSHLAGLRSGTVRGIRSSNYRQYIRTGGFPGFNGGRVEFAKDERDQLSDFLVFRDYVFEYVLDFDGLTSEIDGTRLPDIEDEDVFILGNPFEFQRGYVSGNEIELQLFGGAGNVILHDTDATDNAFTSYGARVNGQDVNADVMIQANILADEVTIYTITYRLASQGAIGGDVFIPPEHCAQDFLRSPQGMLVPNFDICYAGLGGAVAPTQPITISGNQARFRGRGSTGYMLQFINNQGRLYELPFYDTTGGAHYGDRNQRITHFQEAANPGAANIQIDDYIVVTSRNTEISGVTNALQYDQIDTTNNQVHFNDLAGDRRTATFNPGTGEGRLNVGTGSYPFVVDLATNDIAMDQTGDGNINGDRANIILQGGHRIEATGGFTIRLRTPRRLREEANVDEVTIMNLVGNDIVIPSPQGDFELQDVSGSLYQGLTQYGILITHDQDDTPSDVELTIPTSQVGARVAVGGRGGALTGVVFTLERSKVIRSPQAPAQQVPQNVCGNGIIDQGEECDPPGSICASQQFGREVNGICKTDCACKWYLPEPVCGNGIIEEGEECEQAADCGTGFSCESCGCVEEAPPAVCGNGVLEQGEQCEFDAQCSEGLYCGNCQCKIPQPVEVPQPVKKTGFFDNIWLWIKRMFGF